MNEPLIEYIREYQNSHDCCDSDMLEILCDSFINLLDKINNNDTIKTDEQLEQLKASLPIQEEA